VVLVITKETTGRIRIGSIEGVVILFSSTADGLGSEWTYYTPGRLALAWLSRCRVVTTKSSGSLWSILV
jgi:hypothetical protein